jgi:hypothetical protein
MFNLLKPTGYVINRFNITKLYIPHYVLCFYLRTSSEVCPK